MKSPKDFLCVICGQPLNSKQDLFVKILSKDRSELLKVVPVHIGECDEQLCTKENAKGHNTNGSFNLFSFDNDDDLEKSITIGKR